MRRVAHHLFTILAALSLLLCVAMCVLWVRSHFRYDGIIRYSKVGTDLRMVGTTCISDTGQLHLVRTTWRADHMPSAELKQHWVTGRSTGLPGYVQWFQNWGRYWRGFGVMTKMNGTLALKTAGTTYTQTGALHVLMPHWPIVIVLAVLPALWLMRKMRTSRRVAAGTCPTCGYDLRATPDRCPECGTSSPHARAVI